MLANDFRFDGKLLSDFGLMICQFDGSNGIQTVDAGTAINFNTVSVQNGSRWLPTASTYDSVLETTFQIGRMDCGSKIEGFSLDEQRDIGKWLNQGRFREFVLVGYDGYEDIYFNGTFDHISQIQVGSMVIGYELHFMADKPYAMGAPVKVNMELNADNNYTYKFYNTSDEVGYIYPKYWIQCLSNGDLKITNKLENRTSKFNNVHFGLEISGDSMQNVSYVGGEQYNMSSDGKQTVTRQSYDLFNNYNYVGFRIARTEDSNVNTITSNIECTITFTYQPILKGVGI